MQSIFVKSNLNKETTDILILTSPDFLLKIKTILSEFNLPLKYYILNLNTLMEASCCKLNIFDYENINLYEKILYLDTDVLVNNDVNVLFNDEIKSNKLYALEEGSIGHKYWSHHAFDFNIYDRETSAFSAGVFYFRNSPEIKALFDATRKQIQYDIYENKNSPPECLDQPFIVYNSFIQDKYDNQMMKQYLENNPSIVGNKIIYHFPGGPGNYSSKYDKMINFWSKIMIEYDKMTNFWSKIMIYKILSNNFTMVSEQRLVNLYNQCFKFKNTSYSFVECGVAKGGCLALMKIVAGNNNKIFGFDSFEAMPDTTNKDWGEYNKSNPSDWMGNLSGGIENAYNTFKVLSLDMDNVFLIKGFFQDTLQIQETIDKLGEIAVLRLDGDWYESTKICLEKLYDKVAIGGVIIIDDYGHFIGAKNATDEFRDRNKIDSPLLQTDYTEHYWIKTNNNFDNRNTMIKHYSDIISNPKILEIGVFMGEFFDFIVNNCNPTFIDGVDLFNGEMLSANVDGNNMVKYDIGKSYLELIEKYKNTTSVKFYKSESSEYLKSKDDNYYDIIYIDGDHSYNGVKNDLMNAFNKIKNGGYIMGHDYEMNMTKAKNIYNFGVKQAVDEFCNTYKQAILAKAMDGCVSYCIKINKPD